MPSQTFSHHFGTKSTGLKIKIHNHARMHHTSHLVPMHAKALCYFSQSLTTFLRIKLFDCKNIGAAWYIIRTFNFDSLRKKLNRTVSLFNADISNIWKQKWHIKTALCTTGNILFEDFSSLRCALRFHTHFQAQVNHVWIWQRGNKGFVPSMVRKVRSSTYKR